MRKKMTLLIFLFLTSFQTLLLAEAAPASPLPMPPKIEEPALSPHTLTPVEKPHESYEHAFIKMILTLGGLLLLVFFTLWALRKLSHGRVGSFGSQKKIKIIEKRPLSPKTVLYLLELDGKQIFVSESQLEVRSLLNLSETEL